MFFGVTNAQIQFVHTSDPHYGMTRSRFQKNANVNATVVNGAMIAKMNNLTQLTFPNDGGVNSGKKVDSIDFVIETGDIATRSQTSTLGYQSATASWAQFTNDYITGLKLKDKSGNPTKLFVIGGNHDVSNAIGYYSTMNPLKDSAAMVNIYNMMMPSPRPAGNYNYANEKIHYSKNIGGIHFMFVCMWPDSTERVWMANDLATVSSSTPVFLFTHDQPLVESKHFTNPNGTHNINATDRFENVLLETFKDGNNINANSNIEQNAFAAFVQAHPNIVVYFHGNDHQSKYYKYNGPSNNIAIDVIDADSPMKGIVSSIDETKLTFQLISIDTISKVLTVRECLYNTDTNNVNAPIVFGNSKTINFDVANYAQNTTSAGTKICSASDLHLMDPSLLINDGVAFQTYLASDRKLIKESDAIMQELKNRINEEKPDIFLVTGDLTKDGEKISHQRMAHYLDSIEMNGVTKVYVIPGNHDVNNVSACSYNGSTTTKVDTISPSDFKSIYNNFGYGEAVKTDSVSLSYLAKPKSKLWILGIDVCEYDSNMVAGYPITEGKFKPLTYKWVLDRLKEAKDSSAVVVGMMHHGLTEHYTGQSVAFPEYVVKGWDTISNNFSKAGLRMVFTGHFHANDITKKSNIGNTSYVYDIETGSTVTWPCPYRVMELKGDSLLSVVTNHITNINYNTNGMTFQNYALNYLNTGMTGIVNYQLTNPPYSLDAGTASVITPHVVNAFAAHYAGDESIPASEQGFVNYLNSVGQTSLASSLTNLWTDLLPSDNIALLPLRAPIDTLVNYVNSFNANDYTVPSWTLFLRAKTALLANKDSVSSANMLSTIAKLKSSSMPYNIVMNLNKDPKTKMAFNWFTNAGVTGGKVQILAGNATDSLAFNSPLMVVNARCDSAKNLNYNVSANGLNALAGIANNTKISYMFNKALVSGLTPNTQYSFRVGKNGAWSTIGTFKTAKATKEPFSFVYVTDPQAQTDAMFNVSQTTTHAAQAMYPNANFWLSCGDLVESSGSSNSEWEYEQYFETQQDIYMKNPFVPVEGNHDISTNKNFTYHFNTDSVAFDYALATTPGSLYSYVYGDALFMHMTYENYNTTGYLDSLAIWMNNQVKANPTTKWRIAVYHKDMFTGSSSHQSDADEVVERAKMEPVYDSLKIDLAFQGHDHVYEVIGPIKYKSLIPNAVSNQTIVAPTIRDNITGKFGGTFDVKQGTMYFLNNSGGQKKYEPRTQAQMDAALAQTQVPNYFGMFSGRFGQNGLPTFSNVTISTDSINISTYSVDSVGNSFLFDAFKIVKSTQDNTWNGIADNNWNNSANWSEGVTPTQLQNVIIPGTATNMPTISSSGICHDFTLLNNATIIDNNNNLNITGSVEADRSLSPGVWHFIGSPVLLAYGYAFSGDNPDNGTGVNKDTLYLYKYDEPTNTYPAITIGNTEKLYPGNGYEIWSTKQVTIKLKGVYGNQLQSLQDTLKVTYTPTSPKHGMNLVANPFPCAISLDNSATWQTNMNPTIQTWDPIAKVYKYKSGTGISTIPGNLIPSYQGFFVFANAASPKMIIPTSAKTNAPASFMKASIPDVLHLTVNGNNYKDETFINFNTNATAGFDDQLDVEKLLGAEEVPQFYSVLSNMNLAVNVLHDINSNPLVQMGFNITSAGIYTITASELSSFAAGTSIKLEDTKLNTFTDLIAQPEYSFNADANDNANRFKVHFGAPNGIINNNGNGGINIYSNNNTVYINNQGTEKIKDIVVYDLLGKELLRKQASNSTVNTLDMQFASAYYMIKVITNSNVYTKKVYVK